VDVSLSRSFNRIIRIDLDDSTLRILEGIRTLLEPVDAH